MDSDVIAAAQTKAAAKAMVPLVTLCLTLLRIFAITSDYYFSLAKCWPDTCCGAGSGILVADYSL
jgi:hypothetical protein